MAAEELASEVPGSDPYPISNPHPNLGEHAAALTLTLTLTLALTLTLTLTLTR